MYDRLENENETVLIKDTNFNDAVSSFVRSQYIDHGSFCCSNSEHPFWRSFLKQSDGAWALERKDRYIQTSYSVGKSKRIDNFDTCNFTNVDIFINGEMFSVNLNDVFSIFNPVDDNILYFSKSYTKYIFPDYIIVRNLGTQY